MDAFAAEIGRRIRALRGQRGLTLTELAQRAGVGKATLSGLESGTRNPTLETLYAITARLGVPMAALLVGLEGGDGQDEPLHGAAVTATLLETFRDGDTTTELYRLLIRPGALQTSPAHPAGVSEHLTVFAGTARVGPAAEPFLIPPGGHGSWTSDVPHVYAAETAEPVHASLVIRHPRAEPSPFL